MKSYNYLKYLTKHKYYVFCKCFKYGLIWRGIKHDLSKFSLLEWRQFCDIFYRKNLNGEAFEKTKEDDYIYKLHQKRNDHHWQWWITFDNKALEMKREAVIEMLCDWFGASKNKDNDGWEQVKTWYKKNKNEIILHNKTRCFVERFLDNV